MMVARRSGWLITAAMLLSAAPALAQKPAAPPPAATRPAAPPAAAPQAPQQKVKWKEVRAELLRKSVGLEETKAQAVERTIEKYKPQRKQLNDELKAERRALRALLDQDSNDQKAYARGLKAVRTAKKQLDGVREQEMRELARLLTPKEQAKLGRALHDLRARMREAKGEPLEPNWP